MPGPTAGHSARVHEQGRREPLTFRPTQGLFAFALNAPTNWGSAETFGLMPAINSAFVQLRAHAGLRSYRRNASPSVVSPDHHWGETCNESRWAQSKIFTNTGKRLPVCAKAFVPADHCQIQEARSEKAAPRHTGPEVMRLPQNDPRLSGGNDIWA